MKDSQPEIGTGAAACKYIKADNERFSTRPATSAEQS